MEDTPLHVRKLQLKSWLSKTPGERLLQFIIDNDKMFQALKALQKDKVKNGNSQLFFQVNFHPHCFYIVGV